MHENAFCADGRNKQRERETAIRVKPKRVPCLEAGTHGEQEDKYAINSRAVPPAPARFERREVSRLAGCIP
jgi:hypothetical protein